jgi:hypothetical protein
LRSLLVLFVTLVFSLGCMGAVNSLTGLELQVELAENAVHPSDFPVTPPTSGEKLMSMSMKASADSLNLPEGVEVDLSADGMYRMQLISYDMAAGDPDAAFAAAQGELTSAGFTEVSNDGNAVVYEQNGVLFILVDPDADDQGALTLMRLTPVPDAPAP